MRVGAQQLGESERGGVSNESETVVLSPFAVRASSTGRYQAVEATSGSRVRVSLFDTAQSVGVVTRDLIEDISAGRVVDAAKYVAGVYDSTLPNAQDRTTIRGFQNDGATLDGFSYFSFLNVDPVVVERIEVVKGPNAILSPSGTPGGTVNLVSKKPRFQNRGMLSAQVGRWASDRAELDIERVVLPGRLAVRLVAAVQDADDYGAHNYHQSIVAMPMLSYRFGSGAELTVQVQAYNAHALTYGGIPISPYATTRGNWHTLENIARDTVIQRRDASRHQSGQHYRVFFTASILESLSVRVATNVIRSRARSSQLNIGAIIDSPVGLDPATGETVWDGVTRNDDPQFPLGGGVSWQDRSYANLQNDYVYEFGRGTWSATTVFGWAANFSGTYDDRSRNYAVPSPQRLRDYAWAAYTFTSPDFDGYGHTRSRAYQVYLSQVLSFFEARLIASAGLSYNHYYVDSHDVRRDLRGANEPDVWLPSAGLVYKLTPSLSAYYGYSEVATAIGPNLTGPLDFDKQSSRQHEVGVRLRLFDGRFYASAAYFDIAQNNYSIPNQLNSAVPPPDPLFPPIYSDRVADGVELQLTYNVSKGLTLLGNATFMKNRDPDNMPFRGTAEEAVAAWVNYVFDAAGPLRGLSVGIGADYLSKRAGDNPGGATSASTVERVIRIQPSFWLPARTLVNLNVGYRFSGAWRAQLNVDNLLDKEYLQSSTSRQNVWVGPMRNTRLTVTYSF